MWRYMPTYYFELLVLNRHINILLYTFTSQYIRNTILFRSLLLTAYCYSLVTVQVKL